MRVTDYNINEISNCKLGKYLQNFNGFDKLNLIRGNKKIIDIINFCGNKHMYDSMEKKPNEGVVDKSHYFNIHHSPEQYL